MKLVYTHPNPLMVENAKNICTNAGLAVELRNQFASGGAGELAPISTWPELWVQRERDYPQAVALIQQAFTGEEEGEWTCPACGEQNSAAFELCWHCQKARFGLIGED